MPSTTFDDLDLGKRTRIFDALVREFSQYPLPHAQVARIVHTAHISRGAFYVYFSDIIDSYRWTLDKSLSTIESDLSKELTASPDDSLTAFCRYTTRYISQLNTSPYRGLYLMHWQINEAYLQSREPGRPVAPASHRFATLRLSVAGQRIPDAQTNAIAINMLTTLTHQAIKDVLNGTELASSVAQYTAALDIIRAGIIKQQEDRRVSGHQRD